MSTLKRVFVGCVSWHRMAPIALCKDTKIWFGQGQGPLSPISPTRQCLHKIVGHLLNMNLSPNSHVGRVFIADSSGYRVSSHEML